MSNAQAVLTGTDTPKKPHSESNPYYMAIYLQALVKAADSLADEYYVREGARDLGLHGLLSVIEERVDALQYQLDQRIFCEDWEKLNAALKKDPKIGMNF